MNLHIQAAEIARIAEMLAPMCDGDEELFHDMMTGESRVDHVARRIWNQVARDKEQLIGIKARMTELNERLKRIEAREGKGREVLGTVLRMARLPKLELDEVTLSVRDGKAKLAVVDPDAVPDAFRRIKSEPDKTAINDAFADAADLPNWIVREPARDVVTLRTK